ncbi:hypothetical protein GH714_027650 [Hevea brasiliensis]|uniref:Uncharacterized protein n=1 Tax=Hevea brasiliensis TaxID=3981 RepID=A0A6A6N8Y4_HEVBR|nr:hypothetical protein GH714_027650 [Hevea brasiliensis]
MGYSSLIDSTELTPSRGSTPVHHNFFMGTPKINKTTLEDRPPGSIPEPSPTGKKKRLSELFKESLREEPEADDLHNSGKQNTANGKIEVKPTILDVLPKSASGTPYISGPNNVCGSERTANGDAVIERDKSIKSAQCCLPSLISRCSAGERKKNESSSGYCCK